DRPHPGGGWRWLPEWATARGYAVPAPLVVPAGHPVADTLRSCLDEGVQLVLTSGGTGVAPTDRTPEMTAPLLDYGLVGVADAIRAADQDNVPTAMLSRAVAGVAGRTLVANLPGSTGGVRDGLTVLDGVREHAVQQLAGGDHERAAEPSARESATTADDVDDGDDRVVRATVTDSPLSILQHRDAVAERASGAVVSFEGTVRD